MPAPPLRVVLRFAPLPSLLRGGERVRAQRELARACARRAARELGGELRALAQDERGAPIAEGGLCWSIAHAGALAAGAAARAPLGIDLEPLARRARDPGALPIDPAERALLGDDAGAGFLRLWTAKEAVLKLVGVGLGGLRQARLLALEPGWALVEHAGRRWRVRQLEHGEHLMAVASGAGAAGEPPAEFELDGASLALPFEEART